VRLESAAAYLPALADQAENRAGWFGADCRFSFAPLLDESRTKFFAPFLERTCRDVVPLDLGAEPPPAYLRHLHAKDGWISIFFPDTPEAAAAVTRQYPDAFSLLEVAGRFPQHFKAELAWMTPASLGAIGIVLALYFRNAFMACAAILPFLAGVGSVVVGAALIGEPLNFVTMIALLMLCGLSVDFGVFAVDEWRQHETEPERTESALIVCSVASLLGVLPMVLATHPVLRSLGWPLCLGGIGSLLGSFYVVPAFLDLGAKWRRRA
jgi:hypothetical protein